MPFLWLPVHDREDRGIIEHHSIALLSQLAGGVDSPSAAWLGRNAADMKIRESGLWNVNHVHDRYDPGFQSGLTALIGVTGTAPATARP